MSRRIKSRDSPARTCPARRLPSHPDGPSIGTSRHPLAQVTPRATSYLAVTEQPLPRDMPWHTRSPDASTQGLAAAHQDLAAPASPRHPTARS